MKIIKKPLQSSLKPITKHKSSNSQSQYDIVALKAENLKLQRQIAKLKAEKISLSSKITILEENTNERCVHKTPPYECLQKAREQVAAKIQELKKALEKTR